MSKLSDSQLIMLDNLIYYISNDDRMEQYRQEDGTSVETLVDRALKFVDSFEGQGDLPAEMDESEWKEIFNNIKNDQDLCKYTINDCVIDDLNSDTYNFCAATFINSEDPSDINVIFRGTNNDYQEWHDNGAGGYLEKTPYQERAAAYIENVYNSNSNQPITVSGHSKGGNLAMYVTIMTDCVDRCVAIDGQGFSEEFCREYTARIGLNQDKITLISAEKDIVNPLLYTIAGNKLFIQVEDMGWFNKLYHKPNILLDSDGNLREEGDSTYITDFIQNFSSFVNSCMEDPERQQAIDNLTTFMSPPQKMDSFEKAALLIATGAYLLPYSRIFTAVLGRNSLKDVAHRDIPAITADLATMILTAGKPKFLDWLIGRKQANEGLQEFLADHEFENEEEIKQYLLEHTGQEYPKYLVRGALLHCRYGSHARRLNLLKDHGVYTQNCPLIHELNCETAGERNISWFGVCQSPCPPTTETLHLKGDAPRAADGSELGEASGVVHGHKCEPFIISFKWLDSYPINRIVDNGDIDPNGEGLASVTTLSYLVCNWGGLIEPYNSGQEYGDSGEARDDT